MVQTVKMLAWIVLGIGIACAGQQPHTELNKNYGSSGSVYAGQLPVPKVAPLKCQKYEHVEHWPGNCGPAPCDASGCFWVCTMPPPDHCAPDLHVVTEKEWQELLYDRQKSMEVEEKLLECISDLRAQMKALQAKQ